MKEKLSINDYVFVIDEEDVINCYVMYNFYKIQITKFINGNKIKSEEDSIYIELEGKSKNNNIEYLCFWFE